MRFDSMELKLYDTLTREKRVFKPLDPANVRMYVCGPTVYDFAHIGNARPVIVFDVLFRLLRYLAKHGVWDKGKGRTKVTYVRNITDVDDKINARAAEEYPELPLNEAIRRVTERTDKQFHEDVAALGALPPTVEPRATEHIAEMKKIIARLIRTKRAYRYKNHVLFKVRGLTSYGKLSHRALNDMRSTARGEVAPKHDPMDFVLWKPSTEDEPSWQSPAGIKVRGRPGWHIECSAMSWEYLGKKFDIHGGGIDLLFPHHENERAQSCRAFNNHTMARYWLHNGFLQVEGQKMSKSLGNFVTIRELLEEWPGDVLRLAMLSSHYRQPINWTEKGMKDASEELLHWSTTLWGMSEGSLTLWAQREPALAGPSRELVEALLDDLNTPEALTVLRNHHERAQSRDPIALVRFAQDVRFLRLLRLDKLGIHNPYDVTSGPDMVAIRFRDESKRLKAAYANNFPQTVSSIISSVQNRGANVQIHENGSLTFSALSVENVQFEQHIKALIQERNDARAQKDWGKSDRIRDELTKMGVVLKDGKDGTTWEIAR